MASGTSNVDSSTIDSSYYPSCKLRLILRFDEFGSTKLQASTPRKIVTILKGVTSQRDPLTVKPDPSAPAGVTRFLLAASSSTTSPQDVSGSADQLTWSIPGVIPRRATWNQNGIRSADTITAQFKFADCPIDPRTIRSAAVELYLGTVDQDAYARGAAGQQRAGKAGGVNYSEPLNVVPDTWVDSAGQPRTNLRFQGWVDKWSIDWDDDDEPLVTIECRDNTQLAIDVEVPSALVISAKKPIDRAIADYLANFPTFNGLAVEYRPAGATPPSLGAALAGTAFQPQLGPAPAKGGGAATKLSVWDYLTDVCGALGHCVRFEGTTIVVQQVVTLLSNASPRRADDSFQGRTVDGRQFSYRRFIWGRNLKKQKISRNFSKHAPTSIEVRCYSPRRKKTLVVRFPDPVTQKALLAVHALPGDGGTDQKWLVWKVRGIEDVATLTLIAQNVYQSVGRNEFSLELETDNLASFGGGNLDPDVLDLLVGDTFELLVNRDQTGSGATVTEDDLVSRGRQLMEQLGFDPGFAQAYAQTYTNAGFQTLFRLRGMQVEWDCDEGVTLNVHGVNYVEVRCEQPFTGGT